MRASDNRKTNPTKSMTRTTESKTDSRYISLLLPGVDDQQAKLQRSLIKPLSCTIESALATPSIDHLEFLTFPGENKQEYLLRKVDQDVDNGISQLTTCAQNHFAPQVGLDVVSLDFRPLGTTPVPTCRLLVSKNVGPFEPTNHVLFDMLSRLMATHEPYVCSLVIGNDTNGYLLSVRLAVFGQTTRTVTHDDRAELIQTTSIADLSQDVEGTACLSNFELPTKHGWKAHEDIQTSAGIARLELEHAAVRNDAEATLAYDLTAPPIEYETLLKDQVVYPTINNAYQRLGVKPWLELQQDDLTSIVGIAPIYYSTSPWTMSPNRSPPKIRVRRAIRPAHGTETNAPTIPTPPASQTALPKAVSEILPTKADALTNTAANWFYYLGDQLTAPDENTTAAFRRHTPTGKTSPVVIGGADDYSKGSLITAASTAVLQSESLTVVTPSRGDAQWAAKTLCQPFELNSQQYPRLYEDPQRVWTADGVRVVPRKYAPLSWRVSPTGQILLVTPKATLARIEPNSSSVQTRLPRCRIYDDRVDIIDSAADTVLNSHSDIKTAAKEVRACSAPGVPSRRMLLKNTTVLYRDGSQLHPIKLSAPWDDIKTSRRKEKAVETFLETYTVRSQSAIIPVSKFQTAFVEWARNLSDEPLPRRSEITRILRRLGPSVVQDGTPYLQRRWIFPTHLPPPETIPRDQFTTEHNTDQ